MTVNSIIPVVHTSEKSYGSKQQKNCCTYRILKLCTAAMHVDTVNNIQDFRLQLLILTNSV